MAKFYVQLNTGAKLEVEADSMSRPAHGEVTFINLITEPDPQRRDSFGAQAYRENHTIVAYMTGVASVIRGD